MKAVLAMYSSEEDERAGAASNYEKNEQEGEKQQSTNILNRRVSVESQDFEFNKLGGLTSTQMNIDQLNEGGVQIASADELFYKGQLLPLQYNTRPLLPYMVNSITKSPIISPCHNDTIEIPSSKLSLRDQDVRFSSCRMDHVGLDSSLFDFTRSSSFRSHSSNSSSYYCNYYANYASNSCRDSSAASTSGSGESTSTSSRDSNGSSQDSYSTSSDNNREHHVCSCHAHVNVPFSTCPKRKPGFMQSWKILFNGLRRSSQSTDGRDHQAHNNPSFHGSLSAAPTAAHPSPNQAGSLAACGCKLSKEKRGINERHIRSPISKTSQLISKDNESPNCNKKEREHSRGSNYCRGSRWQGYTRRIKPISIIKATLVGGHNMHANYESQRDHINIAAGRFNTDQQQLHKGRVTRQVPSVIERRVSQPSLVTVSGVKGPSKVSFRFHAVSSSCPASVRSSPNHSGLLASPAFNNMSSMQELHSAVQGAIAHCKQSISISPSS